MADRRTLGQQRAGHAWQAVEDARQTLGPAAANDYAREAKRLPVRIMTSGLGHALAFVIAKGGDGRKRLTRDLAGWLLTERGLHRATDETNGKALIDAIVKRDADFLRRATEEAQLYLQWLTRFAEAEIGVKEGSESDD